MKSTRRKNILRGIRQSLNRYLSILFIVALGAGFLAGLSATSPDMFENADHYMDEYRWYDIDVKATQGLTDADLEALRALEGVETAQGARVMDMVLVNDRETELTTRVFAMLDENGQTELNRLNLKEGRMPARPDECVAQAPAGRRACDARGGDAAARRGHCGKPDVHFRGARAVHGGQRLRRAAGVCAKGFSKAGF